MSIRNILVPIDFSEVTPEVIARSALLGKALDAKVWVVHVAAPDPDFVGLKVGPSYVREARADVLRQEHQEVQSLASGLAEQGLRAEALLVQGPTTDTILGLVDKLEAGLIILGSHGRSALFRAFVGSVSEQVLRSSLVPVMVVPSPNKP